MNKSLLNNILCGYPLQHNIVNQLDCVVTHAEATVTICSFMLKAAADEAQTIRILSDNTNVFVLLMYWTSKMWIVAKLTPESAASFSVSTHCRAAILFSSPSRKAVSTQAPADRHTIDYRRFYHYNSTTCSPSTPRQQSAKQSGARCSSMKRRQNE